MVTDKSQVATLGMQELLKEFLAPSNVIAVVGATRNKEKYGYKVFRFLKNTGCRVYPINPKYEEVDGEKCYPSISHLPEKPDVVCLVVRPRVTEQVVVEAWKLGVDKIWMQPGAESAKAIKFCVEKGMKVLHGLCIMIESSRAR